MALNKIVIFLLVLSMAFSGLFFTPAKAETLPAVPAGPQPAQVSRPSTLSVVYATDTQMVVSEIRGGPVQTSCLVSLNSGFLQGSMALGLFTKPTSCFIVTTLKVAVAAKQLSVLRGPGVLPRVVVYNSPQMIQNELQLPIFPSARPLAPLPVTIVLLAFMSAISFDFKGRPKNIFNLRQKFRALSPEQLQVFRC